MVYRENKRVVSILEEYGLSHLKEGQYLVQHYDPEEYIIRQGEPCEFLGILLMGKAKICRSSANGKNMIYAYFCEDSIIGELELMNDWRELTANVIAQGPCEILKIDRKTCVEELEYNLIFMKKILRDIASKYHRTCQGYASVSLCSGEERLCRYILDAEVNGMFRDVLTDAACSIGVSYRHLLRMLHSLCEEGVLQHVENGYLIDRARLEERC